MLKSVCYAVMAMVLSVTSLAYGKGVRYALPADAKVINVKAAPFNAKGDGVTDDTAAIRAAVVQALKGSRYASPPFVYLPAGTYRVTGPIMGKVEEYGWSDGWRSGMILWGEGADYTTIKLDDNLPIYGDPQKPMYVFATGSESDKRTKKGDKHLSGGGNRAFRHGFYHLTVDVGAGNPGAVGIDYVANNRGAIEDVVIRSSDPGFVGSVGLKLIRNWPGPCLYKNVSIIGFNRGIEVEHYEYGNTFENILLKNQLEAGIVNKQNMLAMRNLTSVNKVPVIMGTHESGHIVVINGRFAGGDAKASAIQGNCELYLRDVEVEGYGMAVNLAKRKGAKKVSMVDGKAKIDFYSTEAFAMGMEKPTEMRLPVKETPQYWTEDFSKWVKPQDFLKAGEKMPADATDIFQAALDDGRPVVYLPVGSYKLTRTLKIPPHVRLIHGFQSSIVSVKKDDKSFPFLEFVGKGGEGTVLAHLWINGPVLHSADRAVAFRHIDIHGQYSNSELGTGDMFIDDSIGPKPFIIKHGQRVFCRQLNIEFGEEPLVENHGGQLWVLGYKTEGEMVCIKQTSGKTELLGGLFYPLRKVNGSTPAIQVDGGEVALSFAMSGPRYPVAVRLNTKAGGQTLKSGAAGWRSIGFVSAQAGTSAAATAGVTVEKNATDDGSVVFWKKAVAAADNSFTDQEGNRWSIVNVGGVKNLNDPSVWKQMNWSPTSERWQGESLTDQAPTYSKERVLRSRTSKGTMAALAFQSPKAGKFKITGAAHVATWGPYGNVKVTVAAVTADGTVRKIYEKSVSTGTLLNWDKIPEVQSFALAAGEKLLFMAGGEKGGTSSLTFDVPKPNKKTPKSAPTAIVKL